MKTTTTQAFHTAAFTGLLSLAILTPAMAADFSGSLKGVTITDSQGANKPPIATFTYTVSGETVTFDASGSTDPDGSINEYKWDFGDGITGTGSIATHKYGDHNNHLVTLTVRDSTGGVTLLQKQFVSEQQPIGWLKFDEVGTAENAGKVYDSTRSQWTGGGGDGVQWVSDEAGAYFVNPGLARAGVWVNASDYLKPGMEALTIQIRYKNMADTSYAQPYYWYNNGNAISFVPNYAGTVGRMSYRKSGVDYAAVQYPSTTLGVWHTAHVIYDIVNKQMRIWIDGIEQSTAVSSSLENMQPWSNVNDKLYFGYFNNTYSTGSVAVDEVKIWDSIVSY